MTQLRSFRFRSWSVKMTPLGFLWLTTVIMVGVIASICLRNDRGYNLLFKDLHPTVARNDVPKEDSTFPITEWRNVKLDDGGWHFVADELNVPVEPDMTGATVTDAVTKSYNDTLKWTIEQKLTAYQSEKDTFNTNMKLLLVLMLASYLAIRRREKVLKIPNMEVEVPRYLAIAVVAIGILYLWLDFGVRLTRLIQTRNSILMLIRLYEHRTMGGQFWPLVGSDSVLQDGFLLDAWFVAFEQYKIDPHFPVAATGFLQFFVCSIGAIYGVSHGLFVGSCCDLISASDSGDGAILKSPLLSRLAAVCGVCIIGFSHIMLYFGGQFESRLFQFTTIITMLATTWLGYRAQLWKMTSMENDKADLFL